MAGLPLGEPPLRAAEGGSDRTKGVYQAIEHEPLAGDDTKNGVETSRGGQATLSAPKYQWNPTKIGAEVESEGREIFAQQIHRCHMGREVEIPKRKRTPSSSHHSPTSPDSSPSPETSSQSRLFTRRAEAMTRPHGFVN